MKRRKFIAASALLSLLAASPAQTAPRKKSGKPALKPIRKKTEPPAAKKPATPEELRMLNIARLPDEPPPQWRAYELRATLAAKDAAGYKRRLWLPLPQYRDTPWARSFGHQWQGNFETAGVYRDPLADLEIFYANWSADIAEPKLEIVSRLATQDRRFDITRYGAAVERGEVLRRCLQPAESMPIGGIVLRTAGEAIGRVQDPLAQAKAIYDWVIENTGYDPQARTSGPARIDRLLESGRPTGRSADISRLFVALCRAIGIPARPVFGLRIDDSRLFACLGGRGELPSDRHWRAEFYSPGYGWIPVDPSDVRKAILNENLSPSDPRLSTLKKLLFGFWEMNWIAFNAAQDVPLRGASGEVEDAPSFEFLDAPVVETEGRFDAPDPFSYSVAVRRI